MWKTKGRASCSFSATEVHWLDEMTKALLAGNMAKAVEMRDRDCFPEILRKIKTLRDRAAGIPNRTRTAAREFNQSVRLEYIALVDSGVRPVDARRMIAAHRDIPISRVDSLCHSRRVARVRFEQREQREHAEAAE